MVKVIFRRQIWVRWTVRGEQPLNQDQWLGIRLADAVLWGHGAVGTWSCGDMELWGHGAVGARPGQRKCCQPPGPACGAPSTVTPAPARTCPMTRHPGGSTAESGNVATSE